jgi:hypothetical protein
LHYGQASRFVKSLPSHLNSSDVNNSYCKKQNCLNGDISSQALCAG